MDVGHKKAARGEFHGPRCPVCRLRYTLGNNTGTPTRGEAVIAAGGVIADGEGHVDNSMGTGGAKSTVHYGVLSTQYRY